MIKRMTLLLWEKKQSVLELTWSNGRTRDYSLLLNTIRKKGCQFAAAASFLTIWLFLEKVSARNADA